ncbi:12170_t:CDS:1, partial [Ambispora leptoticha]
KFTNIRHLAKGGFGTVFKAVWIDGYITGVDYSVNKWNRKGQTNVCLKSLDNSKDIKREFLEEVKNQHKHGNNSAIAIYGITEKPKG